jgi:lysophospholipase
MTRRRRRSGGVALLWVGAPIAIALLSPIPAWAISESNFAVEYAERVAPYFETGLRQEFKGVGDVSIAYRIFDRGPSSPTIVIVPGRAESARKYAELIYDLGQRGYSVAIMDLRGQGENARLTSLHDLGYVDEFEDYVSDLETFVERVQAERKGSKLFFLAHSTGGAIGVHYMARHPKVFDAAVLSSPMFGINTGEVSENYAYWGSLWKVITGYGAYPVDGLDKYQFDPDLTVDRSLVTSSEARWKEGREIVREHPDLALGGPSYRWLFQALKATFSITSLGARMERPVTILSAGKDAIVRTRRYDDFCAYRPNLCTVVSAPFADSQHEILQERDPIRDKALEVIVGAFR